MASKNLLDGVAPQLRSGTTEDGGIFHHTARTTAEDHDTWVAWDLPGQTALTAYQTYHVGLTVRGAGASSSSMCAFIGYADASGNKNWVLTSSFAVGTAWGRVEGTLGVPSGMTPFVSGIAAYGTCPEAWWTAPTLSLGSPVVLASSAHTPYATQDHVAAEYATKASLKVTDDRVAAEVTERGRLAGRVGTLESTTGTHTSRIEQLATSIKSLVRGESTYTDPDGRSATSGIYSLVTQARDAVTALFGDYTKTSDLASTQAVRDARKAGTDAQATANAAKSAANGAKSTADSLATLIRADSTGITMGKSADGKTYSTGRTHMDEDSFDVLDKAGNVIATFGGAVASMLMGMLTIAARQGGGGSIYPARGKVLMLKSGKDAEISGNHGSYIEIGDVATTISSKPAGGKANVLTVSNTGIYAQTQGGSGLKLCAVHSLYNPYNGMHVYTGKASEISSMVGAGWTDEGAKFYAFVGPGQR